MRNLRIVYILALIICLIVITSSASQQIRDEAELFKIAVLLIVVIFSFRIKK